MEKLMATNFENCLNSIKTNAATFLKHTLGADSAGGELVKAFMLLPTPTLDEWNALRAAILAAKPKGMTDSAAQKQWERLAKDAKMTKPKSTGADAILKSQTREKEKAELQALPDADIEKRVKALQDAGFAEKSAPVKKLASELKRRKDEANAPIMEKVKRERDAIIKAIKAADVKTLEAVAKLLKLAQG
jgi:hypothetical protein